MQKDDESTKVKVLVGVFEEELVQREEGQFDFVREAWVQVLLDHTSLQQRVDDEEEQIKSDQIRSNACLAFLAEEVEPHEGIGKTVVVLGRETLTYDVLCRRR